MLHLKPDLSLNGGVFDVAGSVVDTLADLKAQLDGVTGASAVDYRDFTDVGGVITSPDLLSNGNDHTAGDGVISTLAQAPTMSAVTGAEFGGADLMGYAIPNGTYTVYLRLTKDAASTNAVVYVSQGTFGPVIYTSGSGLAQTSNAIIDPGQAGETTATTRDELFLALDDDAQHVVKVIDSPQTDWTQWRIGRSSAGFQGFVDKAVVFPNTGPADLAAARAAAEAWLYSDFL